MAKNKNASYVLLDRSGSMASSWNESVTAVNLFVNNLPKTTKVQVVAFDAPTPNMRGFFKNPNVVQLAKTTSSTGDWYKIVRAETVKDYKDITVAEVTPRGGTALNDALGLLLNTVLADNPDKAAIVIMTDGNENASKETTAATVKDLIQKCKDKGYEIVWLGADFKAVETQATNYGLDLSKTMDTSAAMRGAAYQSLSAETTSYFQTGKSVEFSAELKAKVS